MFLIYSVVYLLTKNITVKMKNLKRCGRIKHRFHLVCRFWGQKLIFLPKSLFRVLKPKNANITKTKTYQTYGKKILFCIIAFS